MVLTWSNGTTLSGLTTLTFPFTLKHLNRNVPTVLMLYPPEKECSDVGWGQFYSGTRNTTISGNSCQNWVNYTNNELV